MRWLELKLPPPMVALIIGLLMSLVSSFASDGHLTFAHPTVLALVITAVGLAITISAMVAFVRARTTMNPHKPGATSVLVTHGVYRLTRNPMYLSLALYLIAWAVYLSNWFAWIGLPVFVAYMDAFQIAPEERTLSELYGAAYDSYRDNVRRWF